jgi:hypothetical protein
MTPAVAGLSGDGDAAKSSYGKHRGDNGFPEHRITPSFLDDPFCNDHRIAELNRPVSLGSAA